jgi:hypothetical protein
VKLRLDDLKRGMQFPHTKRRRQADMAIAVDSITIENEVSGMIGATPQSRTEIVSTSLLAVETLRIENQSPASKPDQVHLRLQPLSVLLKDATLTGSIEPRWLMEA